jgi:hypothetical protein
VSGRDVRRHEGRMLGRHWTREEKQAYRSSFTVGRIVDEIWILIALAYLIISWSVERSVELRTFEIAAPIGFLLLGATSYLVLPRVLRSAMPRELWASLPRGRFDAPFLSTPRTYRELFRRWFTVRRNQHE